MPWKFNSYEAVFIQIASRLRGEILRGKYKPDQQIPPVRQLAFDAAVNPNTMQKALTLLEDEGLLYSRGTVGRFVTTDTAVLERCRETVRKDAVRHWIEEARELGITKEELMNYIEQEGGVEDEKTADDSIADGGNA
ncbi:MAG: GntR family transcriptional regulator [Clostridia bacterium]|nr:GntR family transcriptional regulator [Clostridia bacterium]